VSAFRFREILCPTVPAIHSIPSTLSRRKTTTAVCTKRSNHNDCFIACSNPRADFLFRPVANLWRVCQPTVIDTIDYPHAPVPLFLALLDFKGFPSLSSSLFLKSVRINRSRNTSNLNNDLNNNYSTRN